MNSITPGIEMSNNDLMERYALDTRTLHSQENRRQMEGATLVDVRGYVNEYAVDQNIYPEDAADVDAIAERIHAELSA